MFKKTISALTTFAFYVCMHSISNANTVAWTVPSKEDRPKIDVQALEAYVDGAIKRTMTDYKTPGLVISIVRSDGALLEKGYGWSNPLTRREANPQIDPFFIGSVSKVYTSVAVNKLIAEGLIDPDANIREYLDPTTFDDSKGAITVMQLLTHMNGHEERLTNYYGAIPGTDNLSDTEILAKIAPKQIRKPGHLIGYSNYAWVLLGQIVTSVTGQSFGDYLENNIFQPLKMTQSGVVPKSQEEAKLHKEVASFIWRGNEYSKINITPALRLGDPSGGVRSSARDMGRFARMLLNFGELDGVRVLDKETVLNAGKFRPKTALEISGRTDTFWSSKIGQNRIYSHTGQREDFRSHLMIAPSLDIAFFVSVNGVSGSSLAIPNQIIEHFFDKNILPDFNQKTIDFDSQKYVGHYRMSRTNISRFEKIIAAILMSGASVTSKSDSLIITISGNADRYYPVAEGLFQSRSTGDYVRFDHYNDGQFQSFSSQNFNIAVAERVTFWQTINAFFLLTGIGLVVSIIIVIGTPFQIYANMAAKVPSTGWFNLIWLLRLKAVCTLIIAFFFVIGFIPYTSTAEAITKTFPSPTLAISFWMALLVVLLTGMAVIMLLNEWRKDQGALCSRLLKTIAVSAFVISSIGMIVWNFVPDPLFL